MKNIVFALTKFLSKPSSFPSLATWLSCSLRGFIFSNFQTKLRVAKQILLFKNILWNRFKLHKSATETIRSLRHMILAMPGACNLNCTGCYSAGYRQPIALIRDKAKILFDQSKAFHHFSFAIVGKGEPFLPRTRDDIFWMVDQNPQTFFMIFTHGGFLNTQLVQSIHKRNNLLPILSIDGLEASHDGRRGSGTFSKAIEALHRLTQAGILTGVSITVARGNYQEVTSSAFLNKLKKHSVAFVVFFRFVNTPNAETSEIWAPLQASERSDYEMRFRKAIAKHSMLLFDSEAAELALGGCLSRQGRFIHVDMENGKLSPCVMQPFSPSEFEGLAFKTNSLTSALERPFFRAYRGELDEPKVCGQAYSKELQSLADKHTLPSEERVLVESMITSNQVEEE